MQSGAHFCPKTHQTEGSGDDRRVLVDTRNREHRERERDEPRERLGIHSKMYKAKDREAKNLTSEQKAEIWERKLTTAKSKNEMWPIHTTNRSMPTAQIIDDNGKNYVSQKHKTLPRYEQSQKHERGMKKALNSRLRSEVEDPEVCQGFITDKVKAAFVISIRPKQHDQTKSIQGSCTIWSRSPSSC